MATNKTKPAFKLWLSRELQRRMGQARRAAKINWSDFVRRRIEDKLDRLGL